MRKIGHKIAKPFFLHFLHKPDFAGFSRPFHGVLTDVIVSQCVGVSSVGGGRGNENCHAWPLGGAEMGRRNG